MTGRSPDDGEAVERVRQQALLAALLAPVAAAPLPHAWREQGDRAARGLAAYRANAHALAHRALSAACPRLERMLGDEAFPALCRAFWCDHPPVCGDIAEWGGALPAWLARQPSLADWPWLPDAARLDLAVHHAERAADAVLDAESLGALGDHAPQHLRLAMAPGLAVVGSAWPIVTLFEAHASAPTAGGLAAVRRAVDAGLAQTALVARRGWRAEVTALDAGTAIFMTAVLEGDDLATALDRALPAGFDFGPWLARAVTDGWLKGVVVAGD